MSSFKKTIIISISFCLIVFVISGTSLGDEMGDILGGLFESDPYPQEYAGGEYNENEYWVYIQPEDDITTPEMIKGRTQKGDIVDIIPTSRGKGGYGQSKDFLVVKVANLTKEQIARLTQRLEEDKASKDEKGSDKIEKEQIAERKYRLDLDVFKSQKDIKKDKGTVPLTLDASEIIPIEKSKEEISRYQEKARFYAKTQWLKNVALNIIPKAKAATTNTYYVDPDAAAAGDGTTNALTGGTCAFQSLAIWESARDADITAATGSDAIEKVICDSNGEAHTADTAVNLSGWTTAAGNYVEITGAKDIDAAWNDNLYRLISTNVNTISISALHTRVSKIQAQVGSANANGQGPLSVSFGANSGSDTYVSNCFLAGHSNALYWYRTLSFGDTDISSTTAWNTILVHRGDKTNSNNVGMLTVGTASTILANITSYGGNYGFRQAGAGAGIRVYWRNSLSLDAAGGDFIGSAGPTYDWAYLSSKDGTADDKGGDGNLTLQTFSFTATSTLDFRLESDDTGALDHGTPMTLDAWVPFSDDISGVARTGTWDIGADEYVAASSPEVILNSHPIYLNREVIFGKDVILK